MGANMSGLITCEEIAKIAGLTTTRVRQLSILPDVKKKIGRHVFMYDRSTALENWHKKPAERIGAVTKITAECLQDAKTNLFVAFMRGEYDRHDQQQRYQLKKLAKKHTRPQTTTVQLIAAWEREKD